MSTWLFGAVLMLLLAALVALALAVEDAPRVPRRDEVAAADVDRAVAMLRQHDPRRAPPGQLNAVSLTERDVDLLVRHAARRWLGANTQVGLQPGRLILQASVAAPRERWLNVELVLRQTAVPPKVDGLRVGRLPLPAMMAMPLLRAVAAQQGVQADALLAVEWIERVNLTNGRMQVNYRIDRDTVARLRAALAARVSHASLQSKSNGVSLGFSTRSLTAIRISMPAPGIPASVSLSASSPQIDAQPPSTSASASGPGRDKKFSRMARRFSRL